MKKFLILGNMNLTTIMIQLLLNGEIWCGTKYKGTNTMQFNHCGKEVGVPSLFWTNLKYDFEKPFVELTKTYNQDEYKKYDNYDAIEISKSKNIPMDYTGLIGVPLSFIHKLNSNQFELIDIWSCSKVLKLSGKNLYTRLIIKNKHPVSTENTVNIICKNEETKMKNNANLRKAKKVKNDEFYTRYEDIENEVQHYADYLKGQWIYCPCDDHERSNFVKYFKDNFSRYGLKHLTSTHIHLDGTPSERYDYDGVNETITMLTGNGDFRSEECTNIKDDADIVITNPPFSISIQFIKWLSDYEGTKKFLVLGSNIEPYKKVVFGLMMKNLISVGYSYNKALTFECESGTKNVPVGWYTSLPVQCRRMLELTKTYNPEEYPKYDNYDAIEVSKTKNIPMDYTGLIGVPITFLNSYNPEQFEIIGLFNDYKRSDEVSIKETSVSIDSQHTKWSGPVVNGKPKFARLIIRNKHPVSTENTVNNNVDE